MIVILYILLVCDLFSNILKAPCTEAANEAQFENTPFAEGGVAGVAGSASTRISEDVEKAFTIHRI